VNTGTNGNAEDHDARPDRGDPEPGADRILIALDLSAGSRSALRHAAELARQMKAELAGLFVEDENLVRLAGLRFAREFSRSGGPARELSPETMEKELARQARRLRQELELVATELDVRWSFQTRRGRVLSEILIASSIRPQILALGMAGARPGHVRLGSTARKLLAEAHCPVMLIAPGADIHDSVLTVYDGTVSSRRALRQACGLVSSNRPLQVLVWARGRDELAELERQARELAGVQPVNVHALVGGAGPTVLEALASMDPALLVLSESARLDHDTMASIAERLDGALLRVNSPETDRPGD